MLHLASDNNSVDKLLSSSWQKDERVQGRRIIALALSHPTF
jgi:hypothetical protein